MIWAAIGSSVLAEFALLLFLQRSGTVQIARGDAASTHVAAALVLFLAVTLAIVVLRRRIGERSRTSRVFALYVLAWAAVEALALIGFTAALAFPPVPRLALTIYFTGALFLWLVSRPRSRVIAESS